MKLVFILFICFLFQNIYPSSLALMDTTKNNSNSIRTDFTLIRIDKNLIDSSKIINTDSLVIGRFIKNQSPVITDWQFYLPYNDTVIIELYDKEGNLIVLKNNELNIGYYSLILHQKHIQSGMYFIRFKTRKDNFISKFIIMH